MIIGDTIRDQKLQHYINREAANISALALGKIDKYDYLKGGEILSPDQRRVIEQAMFTYSPLAKALEKQTKAIEDQSKKQIKATGDHKKQLIKSNELIKKDLISTEIVF